MESESGSSTSNRLTRCGKVKALAKLTLSSKVLKPILYGQGLSLLICGTAVTSTYLIEDYNADIPLTQGFCNYFLLALVYGSLFLLQKNENGERLFFKTMKTVGWKYCLIAISDVLANFLMVSAYQYTSLTSVQVLDCFVIPVVMVLSWFILKIRYKVVHYVGVATALVGVTCMIIADVLLGKGGTGSNPLLGDAMVLLGAVCYAISNVGMEYFMKGRSVGLREVLAMYGIFGSIISGTMVACLERDALVAVKWSGTSVGILIGFTSCMFILYTCMPLVMKMSSAATVNLSILTADLYALFSGMFLFGYQFTPLYIISFIVIFSSLVIYNSRQPASAASATEQEPQVHAIDCEYTAITTTQQSSASRTNTTSFSISGSNSDVAASTSFLPSFQAFVPCFEDEACVF